MLADLLAFAAQLGLVGLLVYASSLTVEQFGRGVAAHQRLGIDVHGEVSNRHVRVSQWLVNVALVRHVAIIGGVLWHITNTASPPAASFGLLLLAVLLLLHGVTAVLVSMAGFERHADELYAVVVTSTHPVSLLTVLLPHMLPAAPAPGAAALLVNHAASWLLAPVPARGDAVCSLMLLEAAAAVYVCAWGAWYSSCSSSWTLLIEVAWQTALVAWGGFLLPYFALFATQHLASTLPSSERGKDAPPPGPHMLLSTRQVVAFSAAAGALEALLHLPPLPPLCAASGGRLGCGPPDAKPLHQPALLHLSLLLLVVVSTVSARGALAVVRRARAASRSAAKKALSFDELLFKAYRRLGHAQQSAVTTFMLVLVIQLFSYFSIYGVAALRSDAQGAVMGVLFCLGACVQASCVGTLSEVSRDAPALARSGSATKRASSALERSGSSRRQPPSALERSGLAASRGGPVAKRSDSLHGPQATQLAQLPLLQLLFTIVGADYQTERLDAVDEGVGDSPPSPQALRSGCPSHSLTQPLTDERLPNSNGSIGDRDVSGCRRILSKTRSSLALPETSTQSAQLAAGSAPTPAGGQDTLLIMSTAPEAQVYRPADRRPFELRVAALTSFKRFMSVSDPVYSALSMLKGAAAAVEDIFPGLRHMGVYLLTDSAHTNNYIVIGEGALKSPRRHVPLASGTLTHYVIRKATPMYIENCESFSEVTSAFQDVQSMRFILKIKSVACMPILSVGCVCFGCLAFGFANPHMWDSHDKQLCARLAAVVAQHYQRFEALHDSDSDTEAPTKGSRGPDTEVLRQNSRSTDTDLLRNYSSRSASDRMWPGGTRDTRRSTGTTDSRPGRPRGSRATEDSSSRQKSALPSSSAVLSHSSGVGGTRSQDDDDLIASFDDQDTELIDPVPPGFESPDSGPLEDFVREEPDAGSSGFASDGELRILELIGAGGFGNVYRALWRRQIVAVKVMEHGEEALGFHVRAGAVNAAAGEDDDNCRKALFEGAMTSAISHPNVVSTYDYLVKKMDQSGGGTRRILQETQLIMEYCDRGSLSDVIEQGTFHRPGATPPVDMEALLVTLLEVAHAVEYLHSLKITHRDLKPKNILLKSSNKDRRGFTAKVSDFGLSQVLVDKSKPHVTSKYSGTITHMPPELIENGLVFAAGDVYAFGIIMWECYTRLTPYKGLVHPQIMMGVVSSCLRPAFPSTCPVGYKMLAERCWQQQPEARPTFMDVAKAIRALLHSLT